MKRKFWFAAGLFLMLFSINSCDELTSCKVCKQITINASTGDTINEGAETEYCDAALLRIEATGPQTVLGVTTKWECR
jgi:hypothetical protein